jgi:hypothetical protein
MQFAHFGGENSMLSMILTSSFQDRVVGNGNRSYDWIGMKEEEAEARPKLHTKKCLAASGCYIANSGAWKIVLPFLKIFKKRPPQI